ncbi:hypothetical protein B0O99DRAFT_684512 [Bisporella sp. PMI_857]|nr:hypothetical protein B0O99DRAFT_684512 [Bisporella sp. PMI_857]
MAYDQGYYQQPQRSYNGPAAQRPRPPQDYQQPPPQQYPPQGGYDPYPQDGYYDDGYDNGYDQGYNGQGGYQNQNMNGGGRGQDPYGGRGNGYAPQNQSYPPPQRGPPQQDYYEPPRGGAMPPPNRGRGGPIQRPPTADGMRGGYDQRAGEGQGRGYSNGGPPNNGQAMGRGGRPAPLDRAGSSDPGSTRGPGPRKPLKTPPMSPDTTAWDNPFPTFPNTKKRTARDEEQQIIERMESLEMTGQPPQNRPRTAGSKGSQDRYPPGRGPSFDDYGARPRPSVDSQRSMPGRGPPQVSSQGYPDQRRGPPGQAPREARQNGYPEPGYNDRGYDPGPASPIRDDFAPPGRSMTMPNQQPRGPGGQPPMPMDPIASERPYNGPIGRGMPPRPSTATGARPPLQRTYASDGPVPSQQAYPSDPYANRPIDNGRLQAPANMQKHESVSDFYDSYYDPPEPQGGPRNSSQSQPDMPNFDSGGQNPANEQYPARALSFEAQNGYQQQLRPMKSQPDFRSRAQPQAAVFEMVGEAPPPLPNQYQPNYPEDRYGPQNGNYNAQQPPNQQSYGQPPQNGYPPRSTSAAPRMNTPGGGLPNGPKPGGGFVGLPSGPSPNAMPKLGPDALPSHPAPVRPGLSNSVPGSTSNPTPMANNKPVPVRNYNNINSGTTPVQAPQPAATPAAAAKPATPPPVTQAEIDALTARVKAQPQDKETAMILVRKLVEACDVLVPSIPDQRHRNKAREQNVNAAYKLLKKLVAADDVNAMFYLADCYGRGSLGLEADNKEAFTLYQSAAKGNHPQAAYRTAVCCELGNEEGGGTRKDPLKAMQWYNRAAKLGDTPAMYKMGMIQLKGLLGQQKNPREAVVWLKRAAELADAENPHSLHELGLLYEAPQVPDGSIIRDEMYSFSLFKQAADLGYKFSQFRLGAAYEYGLFNCPIDPRQSIMWYSRAAVQEEHQSELALSGWYLTGSEGVLQQSDTEAYLWARKAAMAGNAKAEYAMGYFTETGIGIPANLEDAKRWYWRAAAQNFPKARERLEDLKKGGKNANLKARERISRSKVGKQNEGECSVM